MYVLHHVGAYPVFCWSFHYFDARLARRRMVAVVALQRRCRKNTQTHTYMLHFFQIHVMGVMTTQVDYTMTSQDPATLSSADALFTTAFLALAVIRSQ